MSIMSSVPKATKSTISNLTVVPESWDSYPTVDRCTIDRVQFENLNGSSHLERSTLTDVTVKSYNKNTRSNHIERSQLNCCTVAGAYIARCQLTNTSITGSDHIERVEARDTQFVSARHVERSVCEESLVLGKSCAQRSTVKNSVIADSSWVERSEVHGTVMTRSRVERSVLNDCEVMDCQIEKTNFEGMTLKYGIWKDGDLVGRTCKEEEVVVVPKLRGQRRNEERDDVGTPPPSEHRPNLAPGRSVSVRLPDRSSTARYPPDKVGLPHDGSVSPASSSSRSTLSLVSLEAPEREPPPSYESLHSAGIL